MQNGATGLFSCPKRLADVNPFELELSYIVSRDEMTILLNNICSNLLQPMTLIQFSGKAKRIDAMLPAVFIRPSCSNFRLAAGTEPCEDCDYCHASLYEGLKVDEIATELPKRIQAGIHRSSKYVWSTDIIQFFPPSSEEHPTKYGFVEYVCPILGYRELAFPIVFEGYVLGVLIVGQINIKKRNILPNMRKTLELFANDNSGDPNDLEFKGGVFEEFLKHTRNEEEISFNIQVMPKTQEETIKFISESDATFPVLFNNYLGIPFEKVNPPKQDDMSLVVYKELIISIDNKLSSLNSQFEVRMQKKRENYVENSINVCINMFYSEYKMQKIPSIADTIRNANKSLNINPNNVLRALWTLIGKTVDELRDKLLPITIEIYSSDKFLLEERDKLVRVYPRKTTPGTDIVSIKYIKDRQKVESTLMDYSLWKNIEPLSGQNLKENGAFAILFPVQGLLAFSVLMRVVPPPQTTENILKAIDKFMQIFGNMLFSAFVSQMAVLSDVSTKTTLRVYGHEIVHAAMGLENSYFNNLPSLPTKSKSAVKTIEDIKLDLESSYFLFTSLKENVKLILGQQVSIEKTDYDVWIFKELFYKWQRLFRDHINTKCLNLEIPYVNEYDYSRAPFKTDKKLMEQIVYNLIDNAIKYCYWGTKIHMDCQRVHENSCVRLFSIENYGRDIEAGDAPYELFTRGQEGGDGEGVGLFIVKRAATLLEGDVKHIPKEISKWYVPYLEAYTKLDDIDASLREEAIVELSELKNSGLYWDIVSHEINHIEVLRETVLKKINTPTYKVRFEVTI